MCVRCGGNSRADRESTFLYNYTVTLIVYVFAQKENTCHLRVLWTNCARFCQELLRGFLSKSALPGISLNEPFIGKVGEKNLFLAGTTLTMFACYLIAASDAGIGEHEGTANGAKCHYLWRYNHGCSSRKFRPSMGSGHASGAPVSKTCKKPSEMGLFWLISSIFCNSVRASERQYCLRSVAFTPTGEDLPSLSTIHGIISSLVPFAVPCFLYKLTIVCTRPMSRRDAFVLMLLLLGIFI